MSTPCLIAISTTKGFRSIYCQSDGYPNGVGQMLLLYYRHARQIRALFRLGDLSVLGEQLGEKHDFDWSGKVPARHISSDPRFKICRAYGRDRGEEACRARYHRSFANLIDNADECGAQWLYVWHGELWLFSPVTPTLILIHMSILTHRECQIDS